MIIMEKIHPLLLIFLSTAFGALVTYFFKTVFQRKSISEVVKSSVSSSLESAFKTHVLIHHQKNPSEMIDEKIKSYSREVEYKLEQRDLQIKAIRNNGIISKEMLHGIDISIAGILGELKLLKEKNKNASN